MPADHKTRNSGLEGICFMLAFLLTGACEIRAEDSCSDILARDLANKSILATNSDSSLALHHAQCIKSAASHR
jgi:hypothetical protein